MWSAGSWPSCSRREEAENELFTYIDGWYNRQRIQARLGWQSPDEYEAAWHISRAQPEPATAR
jgi:transposase InsO family protein